MIQSTYLPNTYTGNASQTVFPFNFRIIEKTDLVITVAGVTQTLNVDYTVADAYVDNPSGGQAVFISGAPAQGAAIVLSRSTAKTQLEQFTEGGPFPAAVVEEALDKLTMISQEGIGAPPAPPAGGGLNATGRTAISQNANSYTITHSLNNASAFLVMAVTNWAEGGVFITAQDANTISIAWPITCPYATGGSLQWGVL